MASGLGGYLAGRLRTKWIEIHADEAYFRDTAHGFLAWAVASLLTSVIGLIVGGGVRAGAPVAGSVATVATAGAAAAGASGADSGSMGYFIDSLFRKDINASATTSRGSGVLSGGATQQSGSAKLMRGPKPSCMMLKLPLKRLPTRREKLLPTRRCGFSSQC